MLLMYNPSPSKFYSMHHQANFIYAPYLFFIWVLRPVKIISLILSWVRWGKTGDPREKKPWPPASRTRLVSNVTRDKLELAPVRWWEMIIILNRPATWATSPLFSNKYPDFFMVK